MSVNPGRVRVLSVDDHPLLREAVAAFSSSQSDMTLVGKACNGQEMIDSSESIVPTSP
jgi:DNA-binding NarL/FixJ family response regulator